ncbi:MAG: UDP-glucose/GDP-mannose dehydrogenase family protein [Candidatus Moranbacteria bacterium]|nr:UDP-glucose/GDP-mannose dehydrogenase family protein [Candidatus Moranbacteria bacterium]
MKICIIGSGYVGLVTGACFAKIGHRVFCIDNDKEKIKNLKKGILPIFEPGLKKIVCQCQKEKKLNFSYKLRDAIKESQAIFIAVGTPSSRRGNGYADLTYVFEVARNIAPFLDKYKVVIDKSTVPVGTASQVKRIIKERNPKAIFSVASNPEFLREGAAINDFLNPDRVVIGTDDLNAQKIMEEIYQFIEKKNIPILKTNVESAELIKYASNAFLATKISFINEMANLCEKLGANITDVAKGMGLDKRISPSFLQPGPGYGGSCFPKDVLALTRIAQENESPLRILETVSEVNIAQKARMVFKIKRILNHNKLIGKKILFLGLTFKADTDDMREASSLTIIPALLERGAKIFAHDPKGVREAKKLLPKEVCYISNIDKLKEKIDAVVLLTEWPEYKNVNFSQLKKKMTHPILIDLRNFYDSEAIKQLGFEYYGLGK